MIEEGHDVLAVDDLRHGHRVAVDRRASFEQGDLLDAAWLRQCLSAHHVDVVVHLAAEALVEESVRDPGRFYRVNVCGGLNLLDAMAENDITRLVFSSTAAVYGEPETVPIEEDAPPRPVNTYGESKLVFEGMMERYRSAHGLRFVTLRYFNACGAAESLGECHRPETHLIPIICEVAMGQRDAIRLYGTDYDTPDGTCIRDYVHVADIAQAHILALSQLEGIEAAVYNLGNDTGYSNRHVVDTFQAVTGQELEVVPAARRAGDPARLVASSQRIRRELGWAPRHSELASMIGTAWAWHQEHPRGYES